MTNIAREGVLPGGLPYLAAGEGPPLVYLSGFTPEHRNPIGYQQKIVLRTVRPFIDAGYTVYWTNRKPDMPAGTTMADIATDHARSFAARFGEPVHLIGHSTGGSIALQILADHQEVVRKGVVASTAYALGPVGKRVQWDGLRRWALGENTMHLMADGFTQNRLLRGAARGGLRIAGRLIRRPADPSDMVAMLSAEDAFDVRSRLPTITVPTLVVCGAKDYCWTPEMFAETALRMPNGKLVMYPNAGHAVNIKSAFYRDVLAFLNDA